MRILHLLPGRVGHVGVTAADNQLFIEAVLYRYRAGILGMTCLSAWATGRTCNAVTAVGSKLVLGRASLQTWLCTPTTNTP